MHGGLRCPAHGIYSESCWKSLSFEHTRNGRLDVTCNNLCCGQSRPPEHPLSPGLGCLGRKKQRRRHQTLGSCPTARGTKRRVASTTSGRESSMSRGSRIEHNRAQLTARLYFGRQPKICLRGPIDGLPRNWCFVCFLLGRVLSLKFAFCLLCCAS